MSAGCRCGRGSGSARPDSLAAMPGSRGGTVRSTAAGSSFARGRIAANGATIAPCAPSGRRRSGRPAPRSRGRTPARCVRRSGRSALPPLSNGGKAPNRRRSGKQVRQPGDTDRAERGPGDRWDEEAVPAPGKVERQAPPRSVPAARPPEREQVREVDRKAAPWPGIGGKGRRPFAASLRLVHRRVRGFGSPNRWSIGRSARRTDPKGPGGSCRSGRRPGGVRIPGSRGQEIRGNRGGDDGGRGADRVATVVAAAVDDEVATGVAAAEGAEDSR